VQPIHPSDNHRRAFPLLLKAVVCAFVAFHLVVDLRFYGPLNYLWFCDLGLLTAAIALCLENRLLLSMTVISVMGTSVLWSADLLLNVVLGHYPLGMASYMSDPQLPLSLRLASAFHMWMPLLLIWMMYRIGYDRRAIWYQTLFAIALLVICRTLTAPPPARSLHDVVNINGVYGNSDVAPQTRFPAWLYLTRHIIKCWVVLYLPTHIAAILLFDRRSRHKPAIPSGAESAAASLPH
jgi:hypothetical protein